MKKGSWLLVLACIAFTLSCKDEGTGPAPQNLQDPECTEQGLAELERAMASTLLATPMDTDFTLLLQSADGRRFEVSTGSSTGMTLYDSASTSKLVTAVVILSLVNQGPTGLTLDSKPQDFISFWAPAAGTPASRVTLRHLLSFTSGFMTEPAPIAPAVLGCLDRPSAIFESCVQEIYDANINHNIEPGSQFAYSGTHLQIAGMMAVKAGGFSDWTAMFDDFKARTGLFAHSSYALPSPTNPRLAGGMRWTGEDYLAFLEALSSGELLSNTLSAELWGEQRRAAMVVNSPILSAMSEDWGYGLGNWVECRSPIFECSGSLRRNSSPGAYGAYPFIDFEHGYVGVVARQGALGTFKNGIDLFRTIEATAAQWATRTCSN